MRLRMLRRRWGRFVLLAVCFWIVPVAVWAASDRDAGLLRLVGADAGVVDEHVEAAVTLGDAADDRADPLFIGDV